MTRHSHTIASGEQAKIARAEPEAEMHACVSVHTVVPGTSLYQLEAYRPNRLFHVTQPYLLAKQIRQYLLSFHNIQVIASEY